MSISALSSSNLAATQASAFSRIGNSGSSATGAAEGGTRGQRPDGGAFMDAISSALSSLGISLDDVKSSSAGSSGTSATDAASDETATETTDTASTSATGDAGQALGAFLHQLMSTLHAQNGSSKPPEGEAPSGPPPSGGKGGPGNIESDLQSLIQKLGSSSSDSSDSDSGASALRSSFSTLLQTLGGSSSSGSGDKLASFLQSLSSSMGGASSSGNLVNTTA